MSLPTSLQQLPPRLAHFVLNVERFVVNDLKFDPTGKNIIVAYSGGVDSTALLVICSLLAPRWKANIRAAHLNHNLRPSAAAESAHVQVLCQTISIPFILGSCRVDIYAKRLGLGIEEAGRTLRYRFLLGLKKKLSADAVLTGHHANDLAEDVLLRLLRGTGWPGLSGLPAFDPDRGIVRPLLQVPKADLADFLSTLDISWIEDESNKDLSLLRNRVRHEMLPLFIRENPQFLAGIMDLWRLGRIDSRYFNTILDPLASKIQSTPQGSLLSNFVLSALDQTFRLRLYKKILDALGPGQILTGTLLALDAASLNQQTGKIFQFPGLKTVQVVREGLIFSISMAQEADPTE